MQTLLFFAFLLISLLLASSQSELAGFTDLNRVVKNELKLEVETPPNTEVYSDEAIRVEANSDKTEHSLTFSEERKRAKIHIQGAFGGKIVRELNLENHPLSPLKISEGVISDSSNALPPEQMKTLPELCPRMISKRSMLIPPLLSFRRPWFSEHLS